jgi:hypothetical protein
MAVIACPWGSRADFAPTDQILAGVRLFTDRFRHASYDQVCAGSELPNVYDTPIFKKFVEFGHETGEGRNVSRVELNRDDASARQLCRGNDLIGSGTIAV